jgi:hypothetical protein
MVLMDISPSIASPGNAPQQSESAKRKPARPLAGVNECDSDDDQDFTTEPDQLYDDAMDDADEKWVQSNLRTYSPQTSFGPFVC